MRVNHLVDDVWSARTAMTLFLLLDSVMNLAGLAGNRPLHATRPGAIIFMYPTSSECFAGGCNLENLPVASGIGKEGLRSQWAAHRGCVLNVTCSDKWGVRLIDSTCPSRGGPVSTYSMSRAALSQLMDVLCIGDSSGLRAPL